MREKRSTCIRCGCKREVSKMTLAINWLGSNKWDDSWLSYPRKDSKMCIEPCTPYKGNSREQLLMF